MNVSFIRPSVFVHDEMEIVGHDGHVYKGRRMKQTLPPVTRVHMHMYQSYVAKYANEFKI